MFCGAAWKSSLKVQKTALLARTDKLANGQDYKQKLLGVCTKHGDRLGHVIRERILGAGLSDLHALDARYHWKCCTQFRNILRCSNDSSSVSYNTADSQALVDALGTIGEDKKKIWTSIEVEDLYSDNRGSQYLRWTLVKKVCEHFGDDMIALQSPY